MCLHFNINICCNPVFHLALTLCRLAYVVRERHMKRQLRMLMNKTWLLIPVFWADTKIGPLSAACRKFSRGVEEREFSLSHFSVDDSSNSVSVLFHFFFFLFIFSLCNCFVLPTIFLHSPLCLCLRPENCWLVQFDSLHPTLSLVK